MATNDRVWAFVEAELRKNPKAGSKDLYEKAKAAHPEVGDLNLRQFHARYPLQIRRRMGAGRKASAPKPRRGTRKAAAPRTTRRRPAARSLAAEAPAAPIAAAADTPNAKARDGVRKVFLDFAQDLAAVAGDPAKVIAVVARVDKFVDQAIRAAGK